MRRGPPPSSLLRFPFSKPPKRRQTDFIVFAITKSANRFYQKENAEMKIRMMGLLWVAGSLFALVKAADRERYASRSVLAEGKWIKIKIEKTGIYEISYSRLRSWGFDPAKVSVHGYGGWPLEEDFSSYASVYLDDLPAVAVGREKEKLLFYGRGPVKWEYDPATGRYVHTPNPYSLAGYYFITDATPTQEMPTLPSVQEAALRITDFDDYLLAEKDLVSINQSGRELFGEELLNDPVTLSLDLPEGVTAGSAWIDCRSVARTTRPGRSIALEIDHRIRLEKEIPAIENDKVVAYRKGNEVNISGEWKGEKEHPFWREGKSGPLKIKITCSKDGVDPAYLDYIRIGFQRTLQTDASACTFFRSAASAGQASRFIIRGADAYTVVWDVTDPLRPARMETIRNGSELSFTIPKGKPGIVREFALLQTDRTFPSFLSEEEVVNQDLHGKPQPEMVIIAPPAFRPEAERLKTAHEEKDGLKNTLIVSPEEIYNEFSSGTPDATAYRRLMKMFYDRRTSEADAPRFLLLLGDGAFDNRFVSKKWSLLAEGIKQNMLLTYQTENSLNHYSYVVDDYFGILEDTEGLNAERNRLKIAIGRFPVRTREEARQAVDKVIGYMYNTQKGVWKNHVSFIGDDGSNLDQYATYHMTQSDELADWMEEHRPEYTLGKIYFDAYKKDKSNGGSYPDVKARIARELKEGLLLLNYVGHGNTEYLSDDYVVGNSDILKAAYPYLPVWITATCDFCRFDDVKTSAGENVFLNRQSGGIALFTTSRVAFSDTNFPMNQKLIQYLFQKQSGSYLTFGEAIMRAKNEIAGIEKLGFCLIGDPALRFIYPDRRVKITSINGCPVDKEPIRLKALEKITVEGEIQTEAGETDPVFDGTLDITVFDSRTSIETLGNNVVREIVYNPETKKNELQDIPRKITYEDYPYVIFRRNSSVEAGKFRFSFTVPKDISYQAESLGKMSFYASDHAGAKEAQGSFKNFRVGGTATDPEEDGEGPEIRALYLNDTTFTDGGEVNPTPLFVVRLWDQTGVNVTGSSIGHDLSLTLDNDPSLNYNLNSFYKALSDEKEGQVVFSLPSQSPGLHTAEFKAWDVLNQSTTRRFTFRVVEGLKPRLIELRAVPGIAREQIQFRLSHNRPETELDVTLSVYDLAGRLKWKHTEHNSSELFQSFLVTWDLRDHSGNRLAPGVYLCRAAIRSAASPEAAETVKVIVLAP